MCEYDSYWLSPAVSCMCEKETPEWSGVDGGKACRLYQAARMKLNADEYI